MSDEKKTDSLQKILDEVRLKVARELPAIRETFAGKAKNPEDASIKHAEFLVGLLAAQTCTAVEKKGRIADASKGEDESVADGPSAIEMLLADMKQPI